MREYLSILVTDDPHPCPPFCPKIFCGLNLTPIPQNLAVRFFMGLPYWGRLTPLTIPENFTSEGMQLNMSKITITKILKLS